MGQRERERQYITEDTFLLSEFCGSGYSHAL